MKHTDVVQLWLQDEVKSNRLEVRRVKSEDTVSLTTMTHRFSARRPTSHVVVVFRKDKPHATRVPRGTFCSSLRFAAPSRPPLAFLVSI